MARLFHRALLVCCCVLLSGSVWAFGADFDAVIDGSFEESRDLGDPTWTLSPGGGVFRLSNEFARSGQQSLAVSPGLSGWTGILGQELTGLVPGRSYRLSMWLYKPTAGPLTLTALVGSRAVHLKKPQQNAFSGFQEYKGTFLPSDPSANLALTFSSAASDSFEAFLDDISVQPVEFPSDKSTVCPPEAPSPCFNQDQSGYMCCKGSCGFATCQLENNSQNTSPKLHRARKLLAPLLRKAAAPPAKQTARASKRPHSHARSLITASAGSTSPALAPAPARATACPYSHVPAPAPASASSPTPAPAPSPVSCHTSFLPPVPSGYFWEVNPVLTDEFTGSALNASKWMNKHPTWSGRLPSQFDPANVAVANGTAQLTSTTSVTNMNQVSNPQNDPWVSSAVIASVAPIASYGYYEARLKASLLEMTSSFWFQGSRTEIDVIETIGNPADITSRLMPISTHYLPANTFFVQSEDSLDPNAGSTTKLYYPLPQGMLTSGDFHTYGVHFKDASTLDFYFDGNIVATVTPLGPFNETMYLYFDTEVFVTSGLPSLSDLKDPSKNRFYVDWVHAYTLQRSQSPAVSPVKDLGE